MEILPGCSRVPAPPIEEPDRMLADSCWHSTCTTWRKKSRSMNNEYEDFDHINSIMGFPNMKMPIAFNHITVNVFHAE